MQKEELEVLEYALKYMLETGGAEFADFAQCLNIQKFIGIAVDR